VKDISGLRRAWNNASTELQPEQVAQGYAINMFSGELLHKALDILLLFQMGEVSKAKQIFEDVKHVEFDDASGFFSWSQFGALFLKSSLPGDASSRKSAAIRSFVAAERACKRANRRLRYYGSRPDRENPMYRVILCRARELISKVLGNFSDVTLEQILDFARPGGGSAIGTKNPAKVTLPFKLGAQTKLCVSRSALPYARRLVEESPAWFRLHAEVDWSKQTYTLPYEITDTNRIAFVPKDAGTMRSIAVEPHLNLCLQLGVKEYMDRRMTSFGFTPRSQLRNQLAAKTGAACWQSWDPLVTMDLKAASDSLSCALVERLLPWDWYAFLVDIRSSHYTLDGAAPVEYQKWSSMGNGFTFPLETLIFWALGRACSSLCHSQGDIIVYGDDLVCRRGVAALFMEVLGYCGFKVNTSKSFIFGPFRESCGEDWYGTTRVVPIYLRYMEKLCPTDIYRLLNEVGRALPAPVVALLLRAHRGRPLLRGLPNGDSSSCLWSTDVLSLKSAGYVRWSKNWQCWTQFVARYRPLKGKVDATAGLAAALLGERRIAPSKDEEPWLVRSSLRRRGEWSLSRVATG